jgi:hypothetical protein
MKAGATYSQIQTLHSVAYPELTLAAAAIFAL